MVKLNCMYQNSLLKKVVVFLGLAFFSLSSIAATIKTNMENEFSVNNESRNDGFNLNKELGFFGVEDDWGVNYEVRDWLLQALKNLRYGNREQAINDFKIAWEVSPNLVSPGINLAKLYIDEKKYKQALDVADKLRRRFPNRPESFIIIGVVYQKLGDENKSISAFKTALEIEPGNQYATAFIAEYELAKNNIKYARKLYFDAIQIHPYDPLTLQRLARLDVLLGDTQQIEKMVDNAHNHLPDNIDTHVIFTHIYWQLKKYSQARDEIKKALKIEPENPSLLFIHAQLLAYSQNYKDALKILNKLTDLYPSTPEPLELKAKIALAQNRLVEAVGFFQKAFSLKGSVQIAVQLAIAQIRAGNQKEGFEVFRQQIEKKPDNIMLRARYAELLRKNGYLDKAIQQYYEILKLRPNSVDIQNNLAWLLLKQGNNSQALEQIKMAYNLAPRDPNIMDTYGVILLENNQTDKAVRLFRKASGLMPDSPEILFHLSQALVKTNKNQQAKEILNKVLNLKHSKQAEELLKNLQ